ncbi:hypothetical protein BJ165DRAFT_1473677 [Panaeolus papilionaceus]|nr:hypothetical protein BJ165DRAFT_1473677 [Panaeolus papilionaceus]
MPTHKIISVPELLTYEDDISMDPDRTADGIVARDESFTYPATRSNTEFEAQKASRLKKWINQSSDERERFLRATVDPILTAISGNSSLANALYESSGLKEALSEFLTVYTEEAKALEPVIEAAAKDGRILELLSFSKVDEKDLVRFPLEHHDASARFEAEVLFQHMGDPTRPNNSHLIKRFDTYWPGNFKDSPFLAGLSRKMRCTPHIVEAASRSIIDGVLMGLAEAMMWMGYEHAQIPELKVNLSSGAPVIPIIDTVATTTEGGKSTSAGIILRGAIDYTLLSTDAVGGANFSTSEDVMEELRERLLTKYDATSVFNGPTENNFRVVLVEAKRAATTEGHMEAIKWLYTYEPQVIAEAMAGIKHEEHRRILERNNQPLAEGERIWLPWSLTDGIHWAFGVLVYKHGITSATSRWHNFRLGHALNDASTRSTTENQGPGSLNKTQMEKNCALRRLTIILFLLCTTHPDTFFTQLANSV